MVSLKKQRSATRADYLYSLDCREGVRLLKKSPMDRLVVLNRAQNAQKTGLSVPEQGPEKGTKEFFNRLVSSRKLRGHEARPGASPVRLPVALLGPNP